MSLPPRQQAILDQIEQRLQTADPRLKSMFDAFHRSTREHPAPRTEVISRWSPRLLVMLGISLVSAIGVLVVGIRATSDDCPGLSSDQVVATATVRYAGCSQSTDVWSRGGR
jgi:Protein of unknown function (DUF3040)